MKIFYQILTTTILCYLLSSLPVQVQGRRQFFKNKLEQTKVVNNNVKEIEPRLPRFGGGNSTGDGQVYVRLGGTNTKECNPSSSMTKTGVCGTTYLLEDGHSALVYSRVDFYNYHCETTYRAAGEGSMLFLECPNYRFKFNCYFESLKIQANGTDKVYCRNDQIPPQLSKEFQFYYERNMAGFYGGYICMLFTKPPANRTVPDISGSEQQCGVTVNMDKKASDNHRIVGGQNADKTEYPWSVSLAMTVGKYKYEYRCGGSLITETIILSAAHCFYGYDILYIDIALGRNDLSLADEVGSNYRRSTEYIVHESYDDNLILHDIAVVIAKDPISYSELIRPICLPPSGMELPEGVTAFATGWGATSFGGDEATKLQEVELDIQSNDKCQDAWQSKFNDNTFDIFDSQVCAFGVGKDTCSGDSGGPLIIKDDDKWVLVGITSYGYQCADPEVGGVYTRVSEYTGWITNVIDANDIGGD